MKHTAILLAALFCNAMAQAQTAYKFDFGAGREKKGYTAISTTTQYSNETGYGFINSPELQAKDYGGKSVEDDYIGSSKPFFFSVKLPDGNYDVKLVLGDRKGISATTVRAECRRLMLENVRTQQGRVVTETFTVHVKDSMIRDEGGNIVNRVRLKPREHDYLHWDNLLTIEFNDSMPKVCAIEITPNTTAATVFLAGNSTVVDQSREPWASWGQMFPVFFQPGKVAVANYAESGETLSSFIAARRFKKVLSLMKAGDYAFVEFGHNDQKQKGEGVGAFTSYKKDLEFFISEVKKKGGIPVLVTSVQRRKFDNAGHIEETLGDYPAAVRQTAKEQNIPLIDLNAMTKVMYEAWGPEESINAFVHFPANTFPNQTQALADNTHFRNFGAYEVARLVLKGVKDSRIGLAGFIKPGVKIMDPAKPDLIKSFYWPPSPMMEAVKPDGN
ncbi:MAG TPA: rhamnogalacturonan acetylesterase [Phnomibacter sp.]|nr:rhamnogalacturonan acetylesterase [Phnomibacter sp.]